MTKSLILLLLLTLTISSCQSNEQQPTLTSAETITVKTDIQNSSEQNNTTTVKKAEFNCDNNKRAYEFGREMATMVMLGSSSLESAINDYAAPLGLEPPYSSDNSCVIKGFNEASQGIKSPYNKNEKSWTTFK